MLRVTGSLQIMHQQPSKIYATKEMVANLSAFRAFDRAS